MKGLSFPWPSKTELCEGKVISEYERLRLLLRGSPPYQTYTYSESINKLG